MSLYFLYYEGKSATDVWSFTDQALSALMVRETLIDLIKPIEKEGFVKGE